MSLICSLYCLNKVKGMISFEGIVKNLVIGKPLHYKYCIVVYFSNNE